MPGPGFSAMTPAERRAWGAKGGRERIKKLKRLGRFRDWRFKTDDPFTIECARRGGQALHRRRADRGEEAREEEL